MLARYCESGAPEDFAAIVSAYGVVVYSECRRVTRNAHDAEDAAQLTFLAFAIELRSGTIIRRPLAWLQQVSKRQALKIVRARGRRKRREDAARVPLESPEELNGAQPPDQALTAVIVRDAIDALPDRHRLPIVLHYFGGMSLDAIATELRISRTAAGTRLHRARKALANRLTARGLSFDAGTLSTVMVSLVPASVIANLVRSSSIASEHTSFAISSHVGAMIKASGQVTFPRAVAISMFSFAAGGTAMGWHQIAAVIEKIEVRSFLPLLDRFLQPKPFLPMPRMELPSVSSATPSAPLPSCEFEWPEVLSEPSPVQFTQTRNPFALAPARPNAITLPLPVQLQREPAYVEIERPNYELPTLAEISRAASSFVSPPAFALAPVGASTSNIGGHGNANMSVSNRQSLSTRRIDLGSKLGDVANFEQTGGIVRAEELTVGNAGKGIYQARGGKLEVGSLTLGVERLSNGAMEIAGGQVRVTNSSRPVEVGRHGVGQLVLGSPHTPGKLILPGGDFSKLIVRSASDGRGELRGWGTVHANGGTLVNNGQVIADGHGKPRALDLGSFDDVDNTIENPKGGTNGWYAQNGGIVVLPPVRVQPGTKTYTWGESSTDETIDLVNSVRVTLVNQRAFGRFSISLVSSDYAPVQLPGNSAVYSLFSYRASKIDASTADVAVVYDQTAATTLTYNSTALQLLAFSNGGWTVAQGIALDSSNNIITGSISGSFSYFAVAGLTRTVYATDGSPTVRYVQPVIVVPEPVSSTLFIGALLTLGRRRRAP